MGKDKSTYLPIAASSELESPARPMSNKELASNSSRSRLVAFCLQLAMAFIVAGRAHLTLAGTDWSVAKWEVAFSVLDLS